MTAGWAPAATIGAGFVRPDEGVGGSRRFAHATDTADTIDWLVKNVPETNGRVGILGISYDGFTTMTTTCSCRRGRRGSGGVAAGSSRWAAIKPKDTDSDKVFLVMGPWHHGQEIGDGSTLGALRLDSDTGLTFRREI